MVKNPIFYNKKDSGKQSKYMEYYLTSTTSCVMTLDNFCYLSSWFIINKLGCQSPKLTHSKTHNAYEIRYRDWLGRFDDLIRLCIQNTKMNKFLFSELSGKLQVYMSDIYIELLISEHFKHSLIRTELKRSKLILCVSN